MKTKIKILSGLLLVAMFLIFAGCSEELYEKPLEQPKIKSKLLTGADATKVANKLSWVLFKNNNSLSINMATHRTSYGFGEIKFDEIRQIIDAYGKINYTFRVEHPSSDYKTFFNLVLQEIDSYSSVRLFEYKMTEEFAQSYKGTLNIENFKGTITTTLIETDNPCPPQEFIIIVNDVNDNPNLGNDGNVVYPNQNNNNNNNYPGNSITIIVTYGNNSSSSSGSGNNNVSVTNEEDDVDEEGDVLVSRSPRYFRLSFNTQIDPNNPCNSGANIGILNPIDECTKKFMEDLSTEQKKWLYDQQNENPVLFSELLDLVRGNNTCTDENKQFAIQFITQSQLNPNLTLDFEASKKSPANIDRSSIDNNSDEGKKFNFVFNKLLEIPQFKELFTNIFGDNQTRNNAKLNILDHVYSSTNPTQEINGNTVWNGNNNITINISKQILLGNNISMKLTNLEIAKVIVHECVHAYLMIKATNPNTVPTISGAQNMNLEQLINAFYTSDTIQHDFMYINFVPTIKNIVSQLLNSLTTQTKRNVLENDYNMHPNSLTNYSIITPWNWNSYFDHLSLTGLQNTQAFLIDFPHTLTTTSDAYSLYSQYVNAGHAELDYQIIP